MQISENLEKLRQLFLLDLDIKRQLKNTSSPDEFVELALDIATKKNWAITKVELFNFIVGYATNGENQDPACPPPPSTSNDPSKPSPPTSIPFPALANLSLSASTKDKAYTVIDVIRETDVKTCSW